MTLSATEFLRRIFLHVLRRGFVRIRYFGFLANRWRTRMLALAANCWAPSPALPPSPSRRLRLCGAVPAAAPGW